MRFWNSESEAVSRIAGWRHQNLLVHFAAGLHQCISCLRLVNVKWNIQKFRRPAEPRAKLGPSRRLGMAGVATRAVHGPIDPIHSEGFSATSHQHSEGSRSARL